ncbi:MAG: ATP-binding protein [Treponema sp.]|jgi:predicted AAA+ superfamily ATPase|nr:ATP-binding protein [Treponema sp.]
MLRRKLSDRLLRWKNKQDKMTLVVKGARQVGKTFIIDRFAREQYPHYVYINFDENPGYGTIFDGDLDVDTLIKQISLRIPGAQLAPGTPSPTLIFLDEIQNCPRARTALKFFTLDKRFDVIASGSLLGINYKANSFAEVPSYPVGYVEHLNMYSLDFEEFLWASGVSEESIADIKGYFERKEKVPQAMHERMLELFKEYIVVGGMPKVVNEFITTHHFGRVLKLQRDIISDYTDDIARYAEGSEKAKARACFLSIPKQLAKDYKKFQYSVVEKKGAAKKYGGSLQWLYDADIINFCYNLGQPELPLEGNAQNDTFKVYMRDTGLLMGMLEDGSQEDIIDGNLGIYKGAVYENIIADIFGKAEKKLYYFEYRAQIEIDFFIRLNKQAVAIEVKSADNTKSKSMDNIIKNYGVKRGIKLSARNTGIAKDVDSLPLYMTMFL